MWGSVASAWRTAAPASTDCKGAFSGRARASPSKHQARGEEVPPVRPPTGGTAGVPAKVGEAALQEQLLELCLSCLPGIIKGEGNSEGRVGMDTAAGGISLLRQGINIQSNTILGQRLAGS